MESTLTMPAWLRVALPLPAPRRQASAQAMGVLGWLGPGGLTSPAAISTLFRGSYKVVTGAPSTGLAALPCVLGRTWGGGGAGTVANPLTIKW